MVNIVERLFKTSKDRSVDFTIIDVNMAVIGG